jgi:hypothetical protein
MKSRFTRGDQDHRITEGHVTVDMTLAEFRDQTSGERGELISKFVKCEVPKHLGVGPQVIDGGHIREVKGRS